MSAVNEKKKRKREDNLYAPQWQCPVCLDQLGRDAGFLPMIIANCRPTAHMVCYTCSESLPLRPTKDNKHDRFCPVCNEPAGEFVPLSGVVDVDADPEAAAQLERFEYNRKRAHIKPMGEIKATPEITKRVEFVYNRALQEIANYGGGGALSTRIFFYNSVPEWDVRHVRLIQSKRGFARVTRQELHDELANLGLQLQAHLDTVMADSEFSIVMCSRPLRNQNYFGFLEKQRFVYLPFKVVRKWC